MYIVFDWDGTLGGTKSKLSKSNVKALSILKDMNYEIIIATGRHPSEMKEFLADYPYFFRYIIGANGAIILDRKTDKIIYKKTIPKHLKSKILKLANDNKAMIGYMDDHHVSFTHFSKDKEFIHNVKPDYINDYHKARLENNLALIGVYPNEEGNFKNDFNDFHNKYKESLSIIPTDFSLLQFMARDIDKWNAIKWLKIYTKKHDIATVTFGDSHNDYNMIKNADFGVAMGNANKEVQSVSNAKIGHCDDESILDFVKKLKSDHPMFDKIKNK